MQQVRSSDFLGDAYLDVPADVMFIGERLRRGDPTIGWRGDETMSLVFNPVMGDYEVIALDAERKPYVAWHGDGISPKILADLAASDWQRGPALLERYMAENRKREDARDAREADQRALIADKMLHATNVAFRHLTGGGRRVFGYTGR